MHYSPPAGGTVYTACQRAIDCAKIHQTVVRFTVNDTEMEVYPNYNAEQAAEVYNLKRQMHIIAERLKRFSF